MRARPSPPRKLQQGDLCEGFCSGALERDDWLIRFAWQSQQSHNSTTYVIFADGRVVGYYAIAVASLFRQDVPLLVARNTTMQVPCLLLGRLAVDRTVQRMGYGKALLADALQHAASLAESVGIRAVLVYARDEAARRFYLSLAEFLLSPVDPLQLMLPVADITHQPPAYRAPLE